MMGPPTKAVAKGRSPSTSPERGKSVASIPQSASSKSVAPGAKKAPPGSKFVQTPGTNFLNEFSNKLF